jgi:hypothetical protein
MKTLKITLLLSAMLAAPVVAEAAEPETKTLKAEAVEEPEAIRRADAPPRRLRHRRSGGVAQSGLRHEVEGIEYVGRVEWIGDGMLRLSEPVPEARRRAVSEAKEVPLASVPKRISRTVYLDGGDDIARLRRLVGEEISATLRMNGRGFFYLESFTRMSGR